MVYSVLCEAGFGAMAQHPHEGPSGALGLAELWVGCQHTLVAAGFGLPSAPSSPGRRRRRGHHDEASRVHFDHQQILPALRVLCDLGLCRARAKPRHESPEPPNGGGAEDARGGRLSESNREASFVSTPIESGSVAEEQEWASSADMVFEAVLPESFT